MDIFFCDICNESVPQSDLDGGKAVRRGERVVCAACDLAMSNEGVGGGGEAAASLAATVSAASALSAEVSEGGASAVDGDVAQVAPEAPAGRAARGGGSGKALGCSVALLFVGVVGSIGLGIVLWLRGVAAQGEALAAQAISEAQDEAMAKRFRDLQTSLSMQGQEKDQFVRNGFESLGGRLDEKTANLGNRMGRSENALEALRLSAGEDRRVLEGSVKEATAASGLAKAGVDAMGEELEYLADRVVALEEVLKGGVVGGGGLGGRQPAWYSQLPGLKDANAGNRWNAVTVLGDTGDARVVPHLLPMLKDEDVFVRMATARVLGDLGVAAAIPGLIDGLGDVQAAVREACVVGLRVLSGKDFRFDPLGKDADRRKAQGNWREWWSDNSGRLLGE
jgi:hypothetical protein